MERLTVSLDDLAKYMIRKWKMLVVCVCAFAVLFAASAIIFDEKITIPPSEDYLELKEQEADFEEYIEESPVFKIKSKNVYECIVYVSDISERSLLKSRVDAGYIWDEFEDENFRKYFSDLVTWYDVGIDSADIKVQYFEEGKCKEIVTYLSNQLKSFDEQLEVLQGEVCIVNDEQIYEVQQWYKNRLNAVQGQLEYAATGYTIKVSLPIAIVIGAVAGMFIAVTFLFLMFLFDKKLRSNEELEYYTQNVIVAKIKNSKIQRDLPEVGTIEFEEMIQIKYGSKEQMVVINLTKSEISADGFSVIQGIDFTKKEDYIKKIYNSNVMVAATSNETLYKELKAVLDYLKLNEKEICGCIVG